MSQIVWLLSLCRLAPIQCVLSGHPMTTGNPRIDYFISLTDFEPETAATHYTESLICLSAPFAQMPLPVLQGPSPSRAEIGFPVDQRVYFLPAALFKIHPHMDQAFALLLARDPEAVIVLIQARDYRWHETLRQRFQAHLPDVWQRILFLPWTDHVTFLWRMVQAEIVLDTFYFGLVSTAYQALGLGIPVVTWPGPWMRSRIVAGLYRRMGITGGVAESLADYVEKAYVLSTDRSQYTALSQRIQQRTALIFEADAGLRELIQLFLGWVHAAGLERPS